MTKKIKKLGVLLAVSCLVSCFLFIPTSFGQEALPKPGEVIDKSNIAKYKHLFPEEFVPYFTDGYAGLMEPWSIKVKETEPAPILRKYWEFSQKNRGKYGIDSEGYISGGYDSLGFPFPGVDTKDKDFAIKLMWNYEYRYWMDDRQGPHWQMDKRKGEPIKRYVNSETQVWYINRMFQDPKPFYDTPNKLRRAFLMPWHYPPHQRNFMMLFYRYLDPRKPDDTYLYIPSMRRVLRGEAGQRSTPVMGSTQAPDDFEGFDGRAPEFNFKFVGEQKVMGVAAARLQSWDELKDSIELPIPKENWEVRDVYVIEITPKDPKYPLSKKVIYLDKENWHNIYYSIGWDRAGQPFKVWTCFWRKDEMPGDQTMQTLYGIFGSDIQFGMANLFWNNWKINFIGIEHSELLPSAMRKWAR